MIEVVSAMMLDDDGRIFLQRRTEQPPHPLAGRWETPGGKVEPGESHVESLLRELGEELDLHLEGEAVGQRVATCRVLLDPVLLRDSRLFQVHLYEVEVDPSLLPGDDLGRLRAATRVWVQPIYAMTAMLCVPSFREFYPEIARHSACGARGH